MTDPDPMFATYARLPSAEATTMCEVSRAVGIRAATRRALGSTTRSSFIPSAVTSSRPSESAFKPCGRAPSGSSIVAGRGALLQIDERDRPPGLFPLAVVGDGGRLAVRQHLDLVRRLSDRHRRPRDARLRVEDRSRVVRLVQNDQQVRRSHARACRPEKPARNTRSFSCVSPATLVLTWTSRLH